MPLTEDEEFELLSLERERAILQGKSGPTDPYGRPIAHAEVIREEYPSETFAKYAEPISQFGGMFARKALPGAAIAGAATAGTEIARQGIQAYGNEPGADMGLLERGKRVGSAFGRGALGELGGRGVFAGAKALAPRAVGTGAQLMRVATGIPEKTGRAVLSDPDLLRRAKSVKDAGAQYQKAITQEGYTRAKLYPEQGVEQYIPEQLKSSGAGSRAAFGKTMLAPEATINKYDELVPAMEIGELDLQSALTLRQTASHHLKTSKGDWYEQPMREVLEKADEYLEKKLEGFPEAVKAYREAKTAEEFSSLLPLNKNLSPNVLRTGAALAYAAHGAAEGKILPMVALPVVSPKVWGLGIRAATTPTGQEVLKAGVRYGTQYGARQILPSSTDMLMRKYEAQK